MNKIIFILLLVLLSSSLARSQTGTHLSDEQKAWLSKGNRHEKNGWIYLHIEGTPEERGFQHGYLLSGDIKEAIRIIAKNWYNQSALDWDWLVQKTGDLFTPKIDAEDLAEIDGMVEGMKAAGVNTSRDELVTLNDFVELSGYWWPTIKDSIAPNSIIPPKESCSSFIATGSMTADGKIILGHNTMSSYYFPLPNVILDILPAKGNRIMMQTTPGFIHSCTDFFITSAGLVGSETTIGGFFPFDKNGIPEFARMRQATQYASSIDEWCDIMKKGNNGGYADAWLIGDIKTNEIARLELGLKYVGFEKKKDGYFVGSNVPEDLRILRFETKFGSETNIKNNCVSRRVRWKQLMKQYAGKIDLSLAEQFEADHYDTYLNKLQATGKTICGHQDLDPDNQAIGNDPFSPDGTVDGKVVNADMARKMSFIARFGNACGTPFSAKKYMDAHPQYEWMNSLIKDRPSEPWTIFKADETK